MAGVADPILTAFHFILALLFLPAPNNKFAEFVANGISILWLRG